MVDAFARTPGRRDRRRHERYHAALEALEPRALLTVDLTGAFTSTPAAAQSGGRPTVTVAVANLGDTLATGLLVVDVYAVADGAPFDPATARSVARAMAAAAVPAGGSQAVNIPVTLGAGLAGDYRLYAVINQQGRIAETDSTNNTAQSDVLTVTAPDYDLVPSFGPLTTVPTTLVAGTLASGSVQVIVTNRAGSTATLPAGAAVGVQVVARPVGATDASQDVVINRTAVNVGVGTLAPGKAKLVNVPLQFPATLPPGQYVLVAKVDPANAVAESDETNNEAALANATVTVSSPFSDLALTVNSGTVLPAGTVIADGATTVPLKFDIANTGNVAIAPGQTASLTVVARRVSDGQDFQLGTFTGIGIGGLGSNRSKTVAVSPTLPLTLPAGQYVFVATLATAVLTDDPANNTTSTQAAGYGPVTVQAGVIDLGVTLAGDAFPPAIVQGGVTNGAVKVNVANLGNMGLPAVQRVNVAVALRPVGDPSGASDVPIGAATNVSVARLAAGAVRTLTVNCTTPISLANGDYVFVATVTPVEPLAETSVVNNTAVGGTVTVALPFVNVGIATAGTTFMPVVVTGAQASGYVTLENLGNIAAVGPVSIQFYASTTGELAGAQPVGGKTVTISLAPGATTAAIFTTITLPPGLATTNYTLFAKIVAAGMGDVTTANDVAVAGTVTAAPPMVDLHLLSASNPFAGTAVGLTTAQASVVVENLGNVTNNNTVTVTYYASVSESIDNNAIVIGTTTVGLNLAPGAKSQPIKVNLTLPNPAGTTSYHLFARVTTVGGVVDSVPINNTTGVIGTVSVSHLVTVFPVDHGDTISFTAVTLSKVAGTTTQTGTFTTSSGASGTYTMVTNGFSFGNSLSLDFTGLNPSHYSCNPTFTGTPFLFGGRTVTFTFDPTGKKGSVVLGNQTVYFK
jgi:hypothetical protein